jgi:aspartate racemase
VSDTPAQEHGNGSAAARSRVSALLGPRSHGRVAMGMTDATPSQTQSGGTAGAVRSTAGADKQAQVPIKAEAAGRTRYEDEHQTMKVIGLIGGMSGESSIEYYRLINEAVKERLGGLHSAKCVLYSVDFAEMEELQRHGRWGKVAEVLRSAARKLETAGAELVLICSTAMHRVADPVQVAIGVPLLHVADATAAKVRQAGLRHVGLLGTRFTMEEEFYRGRLADWFGLEVITPERRGRDTVHRIIHEELSAGTARPESKAQLTDIIHGLQEMGAEAIILGCTGLGLLIRVEDVDVPLFDTTRIHALAAVEYALDHDEVLLH